ncbi:hypothetical protein [Scytonema sp. NUACC21]
MDSSKSLSGGYISLGNRRSQCKNFQFLWDSALLAARNNQNAVRMSDLNEAIERVIAGLERNNTC